MCVLLIKICLECPDDQALSCHEGKFGLFGQEAVLALTWIPPGCGLPPRSQQSSIAHLPNTRRTGIHRCFRDCQAALSQISSNEAGDLPQIT